VAYPSPNAAVLSARLGHLHSACSSTCLLSASPPAAGMGAGTPACPQHPSPAVPTRVGSLISQALAGFYVFIAFPNGL